MAGWNLADVWETVARKIPEAPAVVQGERRLTWGELDQRSDALAADLLAAGLQHQSKVAAYLYNSGEYMETYFAAFKAGLVPVNTNYRYGPEEITYLFDNADAEAVVFHAEFTPLLDKVRSALPKVKRWYVVADGNPEPDWATPYEPIAGAAPPAASRPVQGPWGRSGDDLLLLYTGGTTGMPKGVMWEQEQLFMVLGGGGNAVFGTGPATDLDDLASRISGPGLRFIPVCPLMHGTGQFSCFIGLFMGGSLVLLEGRKFDPAELFLTVEKEKANVLVIVGDAFAKPMLAYLDEHPGEHDLSSLFLISSSGVMWSHEVKQGLLRHHPAMVLFDSLGSSEAVGVAGSSSSAGTEAETAQFQLGPNVAVFTEDGRRVEPGSDDVGMVAITGFLPSGYYKDEEKSARTFRTIEGQRWSIPGDFAQVNPDGTLHLLGRGSVVINTGGEKVFPEEVEECLKQFPGVRDAVCVGVPDDRFGEAITALVETEPGVAVDPDALADSVKGRLARYKAPKHVVFVDSIGRSPAGKVDYKALQQLARERVGVG